MMRYLLAFFVITMAAEAGFVPSGSLVHACSSQQATRLDDGRVLLTGCPDVSAEIYDPATGTFIPTGTSIPQSQPGHAATLLADGRVLLSGGGLTTLPTGHGRTGGRFASMFNPKTSAFTPASELIFERTGHTATRLHDGRVLIVGGEIVTGGGFTVFHEGVLNAEMFDPTTETFSDIGPTLRFRVGHTATLLQDGRVLIAGGSDAGPGSSSAEVFTPATGGFAAAGPMVHPRYLHTATLLRDGRVLLVGGQSTRPTGVLQQDIPVEAELFDPTTNRFVVTGSLPAGRVDHVAAMTGSGRVLIAGGNNLDPDRDLRSALLYDPAGGQFTSISPMMIERMRATATTLADGTILIAGGLKIEAPYSAIVSELYIEIPPRRRAAR
jgi:hypothetical protein